MKEFDSVKYMQDLEYRAIVNSVLSTLARNMNYTYAELSNRLLFNCGAIVSRHKTDLTNLDVDALSQVVMNSDYLLGKDEKYVFEYLEEHYIYTDEQFTDMVEDLGYYHSCGE